MEQPVYLNPPLPKFLQKEMEFGGEFTLSNGSKILIATTPSGWLIRATPKEGQRQELVITNEAVEAIFGVMLAQLPKPGKVFAKYPLLPIKRR